MYKIISKEKLGDSIYRFVIESPEIASHRKPGQFVIVRADAEGERIPLTIADADAEKGTITLVVQTIGASTMKMAELNAGDCFRDVVGPLGHPTGLKNFGTVICIAGGIGIAPLYPIIKGLKEFGNRVIVIMGARTKDLLIMREDVEKVCDEVVYCTDDGSFGRKGLVTEAAEFVIAREKVDQAVIIGPTIMMKFSVMTTKKHNIPSIVSLNSIMIDGTGMCGGCRVSIDGKTKFACVDGPEFDGDLVDFDGLIRRLGMYREAEGVAVQKHKCRLDSAAELLEKKEVD